MPRSTFSLPKLFTPLLMLLLAEGYPPADANALSIEANTSYALEGTLGGFLENRLDGDTRYDQFLYLDITGTVTVGALSADGRAFESIVVNYTVDGGHLTTAVYDAAGTPHRGEQVGTINAGAQGTMNYENAARFADGRGNIVAGVYTNITFPDCSLPLGSGHGDLGIAPNTGLSGTVGHTSFSDLGVAFQGNSMEMGGPEFTPFNYVGSFMASFGEHGGTHFGFHGWINNLSSSFLGLSSEFDLHLDFHTYLSPIANPPPPTEVPEPATMLLLGSALAGLSARRKFAR